MIGSMPRRLGLAIIVAVVALGCGKRAPSEPAIDGLPAIDQPWTTAQLAQAVPVLSALCDRDPLRLPAYGSRTFARLSAADNRTAIVAAPLEARVADHARHTGAVLQLYQLYMACGRPTETLALNAALIEGYAASTVDGDALIATLPPDAPDTAARKAGRAQKLAGLDGGITSTIDMLADPKLGPPVDAAIASRLGAAIGAARRAAPGALDPSLAHLDEVIAAELDPARKTMLTAVRDAAR